MHPDHQHMHRAWQVIVGLGRGSGGAQRRVRLVGEGSSVWDYSARVQGSRGGKPRRKGLQATEQRGKEGQRRENQYMKCLAQYVASAHGPIVLVPVVGNAEHQHTDKLENNWTTWYVR